MYLRILKKDLKRKKTMNIILLIFIILSTMFVASSVNNIYTVTNALDYFFEKAGMTDYFVATIDKNGECSVAEVLDGIEEVDSYGIEPVFYMNPENIYYDGENLENMLNTALLQSYEGLCLTLFDENDEALEGVAEGEIWISGKEIRSSNLEIGETIEIQLGDVSETFVIAGSFKDAMFGSEMMGMTRFIVNEKDLEKFSTNKELVGRYSGSVCYVNTEDTEAVDKAISEEDSSIISMGDVSIVKMSYVMNMVIAGILLVVSACLILIAFVVLRFTITFTLSEEYREIGVMKAIGIGNVKIRGLYMVKYLALSAIGVVIGFVGSIPFGNMMVKSVSQSMVMDTTGGLALNLVCSVAVVAIVLWFCYGCTGKVKKFTPVDAIRNGETGERFQKKGILRLRKSAMKPPLFLAANDVFSSPRRFGIVILTLTISLSLLLVLVNTVNTLTSDGLIKTFGIRETDVYLSDNDIQMSFMIENGRELLTEKLESIEKQLAEHGMPAECTNEVILKLTLKHGENSCKVQVYQGVGTTADEYTYFEGTPPENEHEIALTPLTADKLDAEIGDTVIIRQNQGEEEYLVTAFFQSMNNMGEGVRVHEDAEMDFLQTAGFFAFQIDFTDNPDEELLQSRIREIKKLYDTDKVYTAKEYVETMVGVADILQSVTSLVLAVVMVIIALVTVLMEFSFITKERGEIAIMKAIGFDSGAIMKTHILRFCIVVAISVCLSLITLLPVTELTVGPVFDMMGADYGVEYEIVPLQVYVIYPLVVLVLTILAAAASAIRIKSVSASETANIE